MSPSSILRPQYILFSVLFITACNPLLATAPDTEVSVRETTTPVSADESREKAIQQWIRARAEYEKTLDYSSLEQEKEYKYKTMRTLVEAKYFLMLAEKDLQFNIDKSVALDDFNQAGRLLHNAQVTINQAHKQKLKTILVHLDKMRLAIRRDISTEAQWLPVDQRIAFDSIQEQLEALINMRM